jgi:hypothetical protein
VLESTKGAAKKGLIMQTSDYLGRKIGDRNCCSWDQLMRCLLLEKGRQGIIKDGLQSGTEIGLVEGKDLLLFAELMLDVETQYFVTITEASGGLKA